MRLSRNLAVAILLSFLALGCRRANPGSDASSRTSSGATRASSVPRFEIHEWGLVGVALDGSPTVAASGVTADGQRHLGLGLGEAGKPVIYVHLPTGVERAEFALRVGRHPGVSFPEHWPPAEVGERALVFPRVVATRGACATPTSPPEAASAACVAVPDGYCEAAEIPRYAGDGDACLAVDAARAPLLFYRAHGIDASRLPLVLRREADGLVVRRPERTEILGPIFHVAADAPGGPRILRLDAQAASGPVDGLRGTVVAPEEARAALLAHAVAEGLTALEAEAFVDSWAPAYLDRCRRQGPEASGRAPSALVASSNSLLYFAPRALVDAMLPLSTEPPASAIARVFLVRVVDEPRAITTGSSATSMPSGTIGAATRIAGYVRLGDRITARGDYDEHVVRRVVMRNLNQARYCYEQGLLRNPALRGRYVLRLAIDPAGSVRATTITSDTVGDADVARCVAAMGRRWTFPASSAGVVADAPMQLTTDPP